MSSNDEIYDLIKEYSEQIEEDTKIDVLNLKDKQLSSPNVKHKWLFKLTMEKKKLLELLDKKDRIVAEKMKDNPLELSKARIQAKANTDDTMININKDIKKQELMIEYLDGAVNKIFSQMGFDFRNLVELLKMEQL
jgi:hypothetical protein